MKLLKETFVILLACGFVFGWQNTILANYNIQTIGFFVTLYLIISLFKKTGQNKLVFGGVWDIFILIILILLLVSATNGLSGGMFFFLYFLVFGVAFVFSPWSIFMLVIGITVVFLQQAFGSGDTTSNLIKLGTLWLIAPLAFFFSIQYKKAETLEGEIERKNQRIRDASQTIANDIKGVLKEEKSLNKESVKKLDEVLEETADLKEEKKK